MTETQTLTELESRLEIGMAGLWAMEQRGETETPEYERWFRHFVAMLRRYEADALREMAA